MFLSILKRSCLPICQPLVSEEMLEYLKEVKERDERQKRLLLEMKDDFARENYVIHLYQRLGKNGIEE